MNILDTNGINEILDRDINLDEEYYITPDVSEEADLTQIIRNKVLSKKVKPIDKYRYFDYSIYLDQYQRALNSYSGKSFYNMTGFGDVSIVAALHTLTQELERINKGQLFPVGETINVFTTDRGLIRRIKNDFDDLIVSVRPLSEIK
jgi:hypothetical protein